MDFPPTCSGSPPKPLGLIERARFLAFAAALAFVFPALAQQPLPPEKAFLFSARPVDPQTVEARFTIADGYYLYRDKIHFALDPGTGALMTPALPAGKVKEDAFFGRVETYRGSVTVNLAVRDFTPGKPLIIRAESQGCADIGICYPPTIQAVTVALPAASIVPGTQLPASKKTWFN
ncbi:MAG TPA: protein-disulfide reductase DsbD N-terminal domain-containing protein [Casimicrobiaceae bacterium]|jgi:thiol:disulfide interchange protein DsbD